jgi:hypothetical protein
MLHFAPVPDALHEPTSGWLRRAVTRLAVGLAVSSLVLSAPGTLLASGRAAPANASRTFGGATHQGKRSIARVHVASAREAAARAAAKPRAATRALQGRRTVPVAHPGAAGLRPSSAKMPTPRIVVPNVSVVKEFAGLTLAESGNLEPPDPWVAANTTYVVQVVNAMVRVSTRLGAEVTSMPTWALFGLPPTQFPSDSRIVWDAVHGRWVGSVLSFNAGFTDNFLTIAVSDSADPTAGWTLIAIEFTNVLPDYPSLASSSDKIVVADNLFDAAGPFIAADLNTITWASILGGGAITYNFCDNSSYAHPRAAQVLSGSNDVHVIFEASADAHQWYYRITAAGACGSIGDGVDMSTSLGLNAFRLPPAPRQVGGDTIGNALDERPTDAIWQNGHLWWVSTYPVSYDSGTTFEDGVVVWGATTGGPGTLPSAGSSVDVSPGTGSDAFMGGIGLSRAGTLFVIYSQATPTDPVSLYANRIVGGSLGTPQLLGTGDAAYDGERWGDYAGVAMDPLGTGAVWATHEVAAEDGGWRTDVARLIVDTDSPTTPGAPVASTVAPTPLGSIPKYRLTWTGATDVSSGAVTYRFEQNLDGGGFRPGATLAGTSAVRNLPFGHTYQFRVSAVDAVGNVGAWATSPIVQPFLYQQTSSTAFSGSWLTQTASPFSGGSVRYASALGASATFTSTFTRSIGFVTTKAASRGSFRVYIDGVLKATVSAYSPTTAYRQVVYQYTFPTRGTHTMKIYVLATAGHPRVDVDAFLVLK